MAKFKQPSHTPLRTPSPCRSAGQEAFNLHSKDTVNDSTYLLLSSLAMQSLRKANIIKALALNLNLARPEKPPGSFVSFFPL